MRLYVRDERLTSPIQPATRLDRLRADGWTECSHCEGTEGIDHGGGMTPWDGPADIEPCGCAYGLIPPRFRSEAAARWVHREMGRRSGVGLTWEVAYPEEQADYLRLAERMLVEAARAEEL